MSRMPLNSSKVNRFDLTTTMIEWLVSGLLVSLVGACPLKTVNSHAGCYCGIEIDGTNYIHCHPSTLDQMPIFTRSYMYEKLNLSKNALRSLTHRSFDQLKVKRIYLEENPIEFIDPHTFDQAGLQYLEELHLSSARRMEADFLCHGHWHQLRVLHLSGFHLQQSQDCLEKLVRLERLMLHNCSITHLSPSIFRLPSLTDLILTSNELKSLQIDHPSSLRLLNITSNQLTHLPADLFDHLPSLLMLDLSENQFTQMPLVPSNHTWINLSSNPLCTLERRLNEEHLIIDYPQRLHCDCRLIYFLQPNRRNLSDTIDLHHSPLTNETRCSSPDRLQGRFLNELTYSDLLQSCSVDLPHGCEEVKDFDQIETYRKQWFGSTPPDLMVADALASLALTFFNTVHEKNDLIVRWNFDDHRLLDDRSKMQFQIVVEQESSSGGTEVIRRSDLISPFSKQYTLSHLPKKGHYQVCLLLTRLSYGTDKYCRSIDLSLKSSPFPLYRSILFGFLVGTLVTSCFLCLLVMLCRFKHDRSNGSRYVYMDQDLMSLASTVSKISQWKRSRHRPSSIPIQSWYPTQVRQMIGVSRAACCCHHPTPSLTWISEQPVVSSLITSSSVMTTTDWDECASESTKHLYEELGDDSAMIVRQALV